MSYVPSPVPRQRFFDVNGLPLAGGQVFTYQAGTTTPITTYSNSTGTTNTNPVVLDSYGYCDIWLDPNQTYKYVLEDVNNNVQWTEDNISFPPTLGGWSATATYSEGQIVTDSSGFGLLYVSLINNNTGNALTSVSSWRLFQGQVRTVSSNTSMLITDGLVRSNSTSGSLTHTLPSIASTPVGTTIKVKDVGTGGNSTAVKGAGSDNIDGSNTWGTSLTQNISGTFFNNGSSWDVI